MPDVGKSLFSHRTPQMMAIRKWSPRDALQLVVMKLSAMMDVSRIFLHHQVDLLRWECLFTRQQSLRVFATRKDLFFFCFARKNNNRRMRKSAEREMYEWSFVVSLRALAAIIRVVGCEVWESLIIRLEIIGDAT